jgi:putative transposase
VRFSFIDAEKAAYPVNRLCKMLKVSRAGFYAWRRRPASAHATEDARLQLLVREAFERSRMTYGSPRIHAELRAHEECLSRKRVIRLMQADGLVARQRRRYRCTTMSEHDQPVAPNILDQKFEAERPNERWVGDTTELVTQEGRLFLAVILDLFSRFAVGWALSPSNNRHLTIRALQMAIRRRCPEVGLLHHSDQGCTYASEDYQKVLAAHGITCSMSRRGNVFDNAAMESWFSTFKSELGERFADQVEAGDMSFDYIEVFYKSGSQCAPRYVLGIPSASCAGSGPPGCARRTAARDDGLSRSSRRKIQGPSGRGWTAAISPRSTARRRVFPSTLRYAAASFSLSQPPSRWAVVA